MQQNSKMQKLVVTIILCFFISSIFGQSKVVVVIKDKENSRPLSAATISLGSITSLSDVNGIATLYNIPAGKQILTCSFSGYASIKKN